jgi:hypothetical protein
MPYVPPFLMTDASASPEDCKRSHSGSSQGNTLDTGARPDAELHVVYQTQFRFHRFWETRARTPCWAGDTDKADLQKAVEAGTTDVLDSTDRLVQVEWNDQANIRIDTKPLAMVLGNSKAKGGPVWFPVSRKLPKSLQLSDSDWKWVPPRVEPGSPSAQWGIRGDATLRLDPLCAGGEETPYKMVTVWQRWEYGSLKGKHKYSADMCTLPPGTYAGYIQGMPKFWGDRDQLSEFPSIWVIWEWTPAAPAPDPAPKSRTTRKKAPTHPNWTQGVLGWRLKNAASTQRTSGVFVHPGNMPAWFLGCLSPGPVDKQTEWGFKTRQDTQATMWEIFEKLRVSKKEYLSQYQPPDRKHLKWIVIRVEAANEDVVAGDGWKRQRIWLE